MLSCVPPPLPLADIVTIIIQAVGIGIWGSARTSDDEDQKTYDTAEVGAWIVVAGLCAQIASQTIFAFEVLYIQYKIDPVSWGWTQEWIRLKRKVWVFRASVVCSHFLWVPAISLSCLSAPSPTHSCQCMIFFDLQCRATPALLYCLSFGCVSNNNQCYSRKGSLNLI